MSIRTRLVLLVLAVLLPVLIAALWVVHAAGGRERDALEGELRGTTRAVAAWIDAELDRGADAAREWQGRVDALQLPETMLLEVRDANNTGVARHPARGFESATSGTVPALRHASTSAHGWVVAAAVPPPRQVLGVPLALAQVAGGALAVLVLALLGAQWAARRIGDAHSLAYDAAQGQRSEALRALGDGIAHEFNNLLGVINNNAHVMQRHATDALAEPLRATLRAVAAGRELTAQLARLADDRPAQPQTIDLRTLLPQAAALMRTALGKRIEVVLDVHASTPPIHADPRELERALLDLALAARAAITGPGHVWVKARPATADEAPATGAPHVLIAVSDDGRGAVLDLSRVQAFCARSGGRAAVDSTSGIGTTVSMLLPAIGPAAMPLA